MLERTDAISVTMTDLEPDTTYSYIVQPISFTSIGDNVSPEYQVTATTLPADAALPIPFSDIAPDAWYADAVRYVSESGLMSGTSETTFGPDAETTRGMIVTILWRLEGTPAPASTPTFADVTNGQYYTDAVAWAASNGITGGYSNGLFGPDDPITREQMAAILYRYTQAKGWDSTTSADLSDYSDAAQISFYALPALQWANGAGLITGTSDATISPDGSATRAQAAAILMRFCETIIK